MQRPYGTEAAVTASTPLYGWVAMLHNLAGMMKLIKY